MGQPYLEDAGLDQQQIWIPHIRMIIGKGFDVTGSINDSAPLLYEHIDKHRGITPRYPDGRNGQIFQLEVAFKYTAFDKAAFFQELQPWSIYGCYTVKTVYQWPG
jgi:hypothetical protein